MLKKSFKFFSVLIVTVMVGVMLLPSVASASTLYLTRATITHVVTVPGYGETVKYFYVQPAEAREIASSIAIGDGKGLSLYIIGLLPGSLLPTAILTGMSYVGQTFRNKTASDIAKLSESGPVEIKIETTPYGTYYDCKPWDSSLLSLAWGTYDYTDHGLRYCDKITEFHAN